MANGSRFTQGVQNKTPSSQAVAARAATTRPKPQNASFNPKPHP